MNKNNFKKSFIHPSKLEIMNFCTRKILLTSKVELLDIICLLPLNIEQNVLSNGTPTLGAGFAAILIIRVQIFFSHHF